MGGSFDPVHLGHERLLESALHSSEIDLLLLMPTSLPPHKSRRLSYASYRYHMCSLLTENQPQLAVSDLELAHPSSYSYTSETLKRLAEIYTEKMGRTPILKLVYGTDFLDTFPDWHHPEEIMQRAEILLACRGKDEERMDELELKSRRLVERYGGRIQFIPVDAIEISSTELRKECAEQVIRREAYPRKIADFLQRYQPYAFYKDIQKFSLSEWEELSVCECKLRGLLSDFRLLHSCNVSSYACHLARRHGINPLLAAKAGLLHDCCKEMPESEQAAWALKSPESFEARGPVLHAPAASGFIPHYFGEKDGKLLSAVAFHCTGSPQIDALGKILYIADKAEYSRSFPRLDKIRELAETDLDAAARLTLKEVLDAQKGKKFPLHDLSIEWAGKLGIL